MLMPAAILIVILLGSIAVDFSIAFLGEREAASLASAAANDAATAIDEEVFRADGRLELDVRRARQVAGATIRGSSTEIDGLDFNVARTQVDGEDAITVTVWGTVDYLFADAIPGAPDRTAVRATATAVARSG